MKYFYHTFIRMSVFLIVLLGAVILLYSQLWRIFEHNLILNSIIGACLILGTSLTFYQLYRLFQEQKWLDVFEQGRENFPQAPQARILAPLAIIFRHYLPQQYNSLNPLTVQSLLSTIQGRLDESRDLNRYLVGLLIFLGLLGTFWGLCETIGAIAGVINGIDMSGSDVKDVFHTLKEGLQSPLSGMGIAFSSSMFGLASSLIIGFLDFQYTQATKKFFYKLENRLAASTQLNASGNFASAPNMIGNGPAYSQGLLEQTIEAMASLQAQTHRSEDNRVNLLKSIQVLSEKLSVMTEQITSHQTIIKKIAQNQIELQEIVTQLAKFPSNQLADTDSLKNLLRSLDSTTNKMLEELIEGRNKSTEDLRQEIRLVARTLSAIANGQDISV